MNIFSRKPKKTTSTPSDDDIPSPRSNRSDSRSPQKKSSSSRPSKARDDSHKSEQGSSKSSRSRNSRRHSPQNTIDPNDHPLNWPPEHRLSVLSNMSEPTPMDVDSEGPNVPSSPPPQSNMPGSFDTPRTNGTKSSSDGPAPPPHKSPASPVPAPALTPEDAEAFKTAGNKLYKAGDYKKAIVEYTKGLFAPKPRAETC
jgi:DnaJ family protein C protein 7